MKGCISLLFFCLAAAPLGGLASEFNREDKFGPLRHHTQSPFHSSSLSPQLRSSLLSSSEFYVSSVIASVWANTNTYQLDYYQNQFVIGSNWQVNDDWRLDVNYRWNYAGNNRLDGPTIYFHDIFNIDQNGRDKVDKDRFIIDIPDYGIHIDNFKGQSLSHTFTSYLQYQIYKEQTTGISVGGTLHYSNTKHGILDTPRMEQGLQLNFSLRERSYTMDASLAFTRRKHSSTFQHIPYRDSNFSLALGYRYYISNAHTLLTQFSIHQGITNDESELSKPINEFTLGYRFTYQRTAVEFFVTENMFNADNSTDIALGLNVRYLYNQD